MVFVLPQRQRSVPTRLGVTVSKKIGGAVERNRVKRRVREAFRRVKARFPAGLDVVFVARRNAGEVSFHQLLGQMEEMCAKHLLR